MYELHAEHYYCCHFTAVYNALQCISLAMSAWFSSLISYMEGILSRLFVVIYNSTFQYGSWRALHHHPSWSFCLQFRIESILYLLLYQRRSMAHCRATHSRLVHSCYVQQHVTVVCQQRHLHWQHFQVHITWLSCDCHVTAMCDINCTAGTQLLQVARSYLCYTHVWNMELE